MTISERIQYDLDDLKSYFQTLFKVLGASSEFSSPSHYLAYAKADMLSNIDSSLEFWLMEVCDFLVREYSLGTQFNVFKDDDRKQPSKAKNGLALYNRYLKQIAGLDIQQVNDAHQALQNLRAVRNCVTHAGSHIDRLRDSKKLRNVVSNTEGVELVAETLVSVTPDYIFDCLKQAEIYLLFACTAKPKNLKIGKNSN